MKTIEEVFAPVIGQYMWNMDCGWGSITSMQFGLPHLCVREPMADTSHYTDKTVRDNLACRAIKPEGQWHLWIEYTRWVATMKDAKVTSEDDYATMAKVFRRISGQKLVSLSHTPNDELNLNFDLGGCVSIAMSPEILYGEPWMLVDSTTGIIWVYRENGIIEPSPTSICEVGGIDVWQNRKKTKPPSP